MSSIHQCYKKTYEGYRWLMDNESEYNTSQSKIDDLQREQRLLPKKIKQCEDEIQQLELEIHSAENQINKSEGNLQQYQKEHSMKVSELKGLGAYDSNLTRGVSS